MTDPLARLSPSPARRAFGIATLALLGGLLILTGAVATGELTGRLALVAVGLGALWQADVLRRATSAGLVLTETALCTEDGVEICRVDEITGVDRGVLAFKPSGGFLLRLSTPHPRAWEPGLWWRWGRNVGVGGVTRSAEARLMADAISVMLARRGAGPG